MPQPPKQNLSMAGCTHAGCARPNNEDSIFFQKTLNENALLAIVADGMGGHVGGAIASSLCTAQFERAWLSSYGLVEHINCDWLGAVTNEAYVAIRERILKEPELLSMGTTLVALFLRQLSSESIAYIAHIGDSRCYHFSQGMLRQLTRDHSLVQCMIDEGALSVDEAKHSPLRNYLTRSLGGGAEEMQVDCLSVSAQLGDRFLLCSDGLTNILSPHDIEAILLANVDDKAACEQLLALSLARDANDNVSVVLCTA